MRPMTSSGMQKNVSATMPAKSMKPALSVNPSVTSIGNMPTAIRLTLSPATGLDRGGRRPRGDFDYDMFTDLFRRS